MTIKPVVKPKHEPKPNDGPNNGLENGGPNDNSGGGGSSNSLGSGGNNNAGDSIGLGGNGGGGSSSAVGGLMDAVAGSSGGVVGGGMSPRTLHAEHSNIAGSSASGGTHRSRRRHNKRGGGSSSSSISAGLLMAVGGSGAGVGGVGSGGKSPLTAGNYQLVPGRPPGFVQGGGGNVVVGGNVVAGCSSHSSGNATGAVDLMLPSGSNHHQHYSSARSSGSSSGSSSSSTSGSTGAAGASSSAHCGAGSSGSGRSAAMRARRPNNDKNDDTYAGYNSGDEHIGPKDGDAVATLAEWQDRDQRFVKALGEVRGFDINEIAEDGACLFRSISLQLYGDQEMHEVIRQQTMDYIYKNREYFAQFVTEDIDSYVMRKRNNHVHGNHIEIQAISELYNRPVELYCYQTEPINIFNSDQLKNGYEPLRLSYQRGSHYNAVLNPYKASVGVGLGLAGYSPTRPEQRVQLHEAVRLSEDLEIEQTMFEDKLKTTDWEATNSAIEEQIARESYMQWCRDNMQRMSAGASAGVGAATQAQSVGAAALDALDNGQNGGGGKPSSNRCSDDDSLEDGASFGSDSELKFEHTSSQPPSSGYGNNNHYAQPQQQRSTGVNERRRKRRRNANVTSPLVSQALSAAATPTIAPAASTTKTMTTSSLKSYAADAAGPSVHLGCNTPPKLGRFDEANTSKNANTNSTSMEDLPGTSRQAVASTSSSSSLSLLSSPSSSSTSPSTSNANAAPAVSSFYHELLESSYSDDFIDASGRQLSEEQMLQKALQMSRLEFVHKQLGGGGSTL